MRLKRACQMAAGSDWHQITTLPLFLHDPDSCALLDFQNPKLLGINRMGKLINSGLNKSKKRVRTRLRHRKRLTTWRWKGHVNLRIRKVGDAVDSLRGLLRMGTSQRTSGQEPGKDKVRMAQHAKHLARLRSEPCRRFMAIDQVAARAPKRGAKPSMSPQPTLHLHDSHPNVWSPPPPPSTDQCRHLPKNETNWKLFQHSRPRARGSAASRITISDPWHFNFLKPLLTLMLAHPLCYLWPSSLSAPLIKNLGSRREM
jgi:hypothetical protein